MGASAYFVVAVRRREIPPNSFCFAFVIVMLLCLGRSRHACCLRSLFASACFYFVFVIVMFDVSWSVSARETAMSLCFLRSLFASVCCCELLPDCFVLPPALPFHCWRRDVKPYRWRYWSAAGAGWFRQVAELAHSLFRIVLAVFSVCLLLQADAMLFSTDVGVACCAASSCSHG